MWAEAEGHDIVVDVVVEHETYVNGADNYNENLLMWTVNGQQSTSKIC